METKATQTYANILYRVAASTARFEAAVAESATDADVAALGPYLNAEVERASAAADAYRQAIRDLLPDVEARAVVVKALKIAADMQGRATTDPRNDVVAMARAGKAARVAEANDY